jgi:hypothetical protein
MSRQGHAGRSDGQEDQKRRDHENTFFLKFRFPFRKAGLYPCNGVRTMRKWKFIGSQRE